MAKVHIGKQYAPTNFVRRDSDGTFQQLSLGRHPVTGAELFAQKVVIGPAHDGVEDLARVFLVCAAAVLAIAGALLVSFW